MGRLNHVAIAVPDLAAAAELYRRAFGARVRAACPLPAPPCAYNAGRRGRRCMLRQLVALVRR